MDENDGVYKHLHTPECQSYKEKPNCLMNLHWPNFFYFEMFLLIMMLSHMAIGKERYSTNWEKEFNKMGITVYIYHWKGNYQINC